MAKKQIYCSVCEEPLAMYRASKNQCYVCKEYFCDSHIYMYTDEANRAITNNHPWFCKADAPEYAR